MAEERRGPIVVRDTGDLACSVPGPAEGIVRFGVDQKPVAETINDLIEDAAPDENADYLMTWDASAGRHKKVLLTNLPGGAGGETSGSSSSRSSESTSSKSSESTSSKSSQSFSSASSQSLSSVSSESTSSKSSESTSSKSSESTSSKSSQSFSSVSSESSSSGPGTTGYQIGYQLTNNQGGAVVIGAPVYSDSAGKYKKAKANASGTKNAIGLQREASVNDGAVGTIITDGVFVATTTEWDAICGTSGGLAVGTKYFLSAATAGLLTATAPTTVGQYLKPMIIALSTTHARLLDAEDILL